MEQRPERQRHYPGYPTERFSSSADSLEGIHIPLGPWDHNTYPLPEPAELEMFTKKGLLTDSLGRPLHPWAADLLPEEKGGMVTGKGAYWHWGPNQTADPIVITREERPRILLIERSDTGNLALPGGFLDGDEHPHAAAQRELLEETGFLTKQQGDLVYQGPVADMRTTLHAWAETSAYLFVVDEPSEVRGNDDARSADWYYLDTLPDILFGSHARLVELALEVRQSNPTLQVLHAPEHERSIEPLQVGHMAYKHYIATHGAHSIFVKEHDASRFSDPYREAHSRAYLTKEHLSYRHLAQAGFEAIPKHVHLQDEQLLAMEHLSTADGWRWRAPADATVYTTAILEAFNKLQRTPVLQNPPYHQAIAATHETFWQEGWDAIDESTQVAIHVKVNELSKQWPSKKRAAARDLLEEFDNLQRQTSTTSRKPLLLPAHNDARQSNIAWHPEHGVRIVDWSWADLAPKNADATMFLIDLAKSGHDVSGHLERFNCDYAITLIGFWLAHSTWQTRDAGSKVREHQVASAVSALQLIRAFEKSSY